MSDQPDAQTSTWQHPALTIDRPACPQQDLNPQSLQADGLRPTPYTARSLTNVQGEHKVFLLTLYIFEPTSDVYEKEY